MTILLALGYIALGAFFAIMAVCALAPMIVVMAIRRSLHR